MSTINEDKKVLLSVRNLSKYFPSKRAGVFGKKSFLKAVDNISFDVFEGETLGLVGESGCGKSTTGFLITQLLEKSSGEIFLNGKNLTLLSKKELRQTRRDLQIVFQDPFSSLNPRMNIFDLVAEPLIIHKILKGKALREEVIRLLETVGLGAHHLDRHPHEFSGGQKQRIGIARALALKPKMIVCDEAVSALDVSIQAQILNLLSELQKQFNLTYLFIAHGLPAVNYISDRIAVMYLGKIVELADRAVLFSRPRHPYTQALLAAVPVPDPLLRKAKTPLGGEPPSPVNPPSGCAFHPRCPYAQDRCKSETPQLNKTETGGFIACHFPLKG